MVDIDRRRRRSACLSRMRRRPLLARRAAAWPPRPGARGAAPAAAAARKTLHAGLRDAAETSFDPPQTNSDLYCVDRDRADLRGAADLRLPGAPGGPGAGRPRPRMPEVSADGRAFTVRLQPGIFFADDPAFSGRPRELVAQDYVYALKRFYDPKYNSSDLVPLRDRSRCRACRSCAPGASESRRPFDYDTEVEGVRALDRYTLRVTLGDADPRFVWRLADPRDLRRGGARGGRVLRRRHRRASGRHRRRSACSSWRRGSRIVLERSPRLSRHAATKAGRPPSRWRRRIAARLQGRTLPLVDRVVIDIVEEAQPRWLSFLNGSYDWLARARHLPRAGGAQRPAGALPGAQGHAGAAAAAARHRA